MPLRGIGDLAHNARIVGIRGLPQARWLTMTLGDALRSRGLRGDRALVGLLGMLVEDTVHSSVDRAPLINAALGITIRGAGLTRHEGGMHGFWRSLVKHYRALGGELRTGTVVSRVEGTPGALAIHTRRGVRTARQVVLAIPASAAASICPTQAIARRLQRYLHRDRHDLGGAIIAFLGVPDSQVEGPRLTHHQLLRSYDQPLGDGNNMFVSVSAPRDTVSAPRGHRAVMISTHTSLSGWADLDDGAYTKRKQEIGACLIKETRRVYPRLAQPAVVAELGTPRAFERFAFRPHGAVGGVHQNLGNSNQRAIPHDLGGRGVWLVGDSTWPGLGTVACVLGSGIVADGVRRDHARIR